VVILTYLRDHVIILQSKYVSMHLLLEQRRLPHLLHSSSAQNDLQDVAVKV